MEFTKLNFRRSELEELFASMKNYEDKISFVENFKQKGEMFWESIPSEKVA